MQDDPKAESRRGARRDWIQGLVAGVITAALGPLLEDGFSRKEAIVIGVITIVVLGGSGLILRGLGELRASPRLKAYGYFAGAMAYVATASIALAQGLLQPLF